MVDMVDMATVADAVKVVEFFVSLAVLVTSRDQH